MSSIAISRSSIRPGHCCAAGPGAHLGGSRAGLHSEDGFTLAEAVVSMALFVVLSVAATYGILGLVRTTRISENRVAATNLARQELERLRLQSSTARQLDSAPRTVLVKSTTYTVTPSMTPSATTTCATGSSRAVTVTVDWNDAGSRKVLVNTVLAC